MEGIQKAASDLHESAYARRQPVFRSQRFEGLAGNPASRGGATGTYPAVERIASLLNNRTTSSGRRESHGSQRYSSASENVMREIALAEASFNPTDLMQEGLDEWHDKSLSMQLLRKSRTMSAFKRRSSMANKNPSEISGQEQPLPSQEEQQNEIPVSQQLVPPVETRHRYNYDFGSPVELLARNEDGSPVEISKEYASILPSAPKGTLVHLVMLYHQALIKAGLNDEAQKIAEQLSRVGAAELEEIAMELSAIDLLLRDGLLKYLMAITPFIPSIPSQVVKFKNVGYSGIVQHDAGYESIYTKGLETLKGPLKKSQLEKITLLTDVTGYFMPGTLTLIMGAAGCGSLLLNTVIAGRRKGKATTGSITYNGRSVYDIKSRRYVSLVAPSDFHFPGLSVRETLEFSRDCSQYYRSEHFGEDLKNIVGDVLKAGQDPKLETNLSMMGLKRVADRPVGSPMMPSLTEAERHRLSVAEMLAGTYAVYMYDHLNKGIDDSVTFDVVTSLRIFTRVRSTTVVASLIRPAQDVYDLFDRVILLDRSHVVFQGPTQDALPYFESLGYVKPRQLSVPEFLEEVATHDGAKYLQPGFPRLNTDGFVTAYKNSDAYKDICRVVDNPELIKEIWVEGSQPLGVNFVQSHPNKGQGIVEPLTTLVSTISEKGGSFVDVSMRHTDNVKPGDEIVAAGGAAGVLNYLKLGDSAKDGNSLFDEVQETIRLQLERPLEDEKDYTDQFSHDYVQNAWPEFLLLLNRDLKATLRNKLSLYIRAVQVLVLSIYVGSVFFRVRTDANQLDMNLLRSIFFVSLLDMTLFNLGQLPALFEERKIYYKQQGSNFYRPSSYLFAKLVGSLPFSFAEATVWTLVVYFFTNLSVNEGGWHFWVFYIVIVLAVLNGAAMVRFMSAFAPDLIAANGMMGIVVAIYIVFAGFLLPRFVVPHYWIWAYYLDPLQWGITALVINEFNSKPYQVLCRDVANLANFPQCIGRPNQTIGHAYLAKGQFYTGLHWIAIAISCLLGWVILWTVLTYFALAKIRHVPKTIITPSVEAKFMKRESLIDRDVEGHGSALSIMATPVTLSWHELSYDVTVAGVGRTLTLLNYVSGWAEPGEMVGIQGGTGSGASSLLNCLAGRGVNFERLGGQILVNGYPKHQESFIRVAGYCDRLESYSPYMTVREAIAFNCDLSLERSTTRQKRKHFVQEIIDLMELGSIESTLVKSLSHNDLTLPEATRLRIGAELARNPSILFLDAPTKNLDNRSALHMIQRLRAIADTGRVVIAVLPISSHRLLTYFTSVQILKRGGETVYWGPVGSEGEHIKGYFESIPGTPPCPPNTSVCTYAVDVIGDGVQDRKALKDYAFEYRVNELALHNHIQLQRLRRGKGTLGPQISDTGFGSSYVTRCRKIFLKLQLFYWRNVAYSWGRLFSSVITALLLGSIFFNIKPDTTPKLNAKAGGIFISTLLLALSNAQSVIPQVNANQMEFQREKNNRQFHLPLYVLAWTLAEIPYLAFSTLVFAAIFCGMADLATSTAARFFLYWFVLYLATLSITFFGMFLAAVSVLPQIAGTLVTLFVGFWVATSGVVVPKRKVLHQFIWVFWSNPLQYALSALTSISFFCEVEKPECLNGGLNPGCATNQALCPTCNCERLRDTKAFVWSTIKFNRSLKHGIIPYEILALICFAIIFRTASFFVWKYRDTKKK